MDAATQAESDAYVDRQIKKMFQDLNVRMARSLGAAVNQALAKERERMAAELAARDARITALEEELRAATSQPFAEEGERITAELAARDARTTTLEEGLASAPETVAAVPKPNGGAT